MRTVSDSEIQIADVCWVRRITITVGGRQHEVVLGPDDDWTCDAALMAHVGEQGLEQVRKALLADVSHQETRSRLKLGVTNGDSG